MNTANGYRITPQMPLPSGFGTETAAAEALGGRGLSGKIAIDWPRLSNLSSAAFQLCLKPSNRTTRFDVTTAVFCSHQLATVPQVKELTRRVDIHRGESLWL